MSHDQQKLEKDILSFWKENRSFKKSNENRPGVPFITYDGPPFATGLPHFGHILVSVIKDTVCRYQNMLGHPVPRVFGWDCHGLPVESIAQSELNITTHEIIKNDRVPEFNNKCRALVFRCVNQWETTIDRIGRWVDYYNAYKTMDLNYMESVWWVFKQVYEQGRIYKAHRIMPYSPKLGTPLSNFEITDSYREVSDDYVVVSFETVIGHRLVKLLAYTTTPWTLPCNAALCLNPNNDYSIVQVEDLGYYLVATTLIDNVFTTPGKTKTIIETKKGKDYAGLVYEPLYETKGQTYKTVCDAYVSDKDGTGIVHIAPAYGEDDYRVGKDNNLSVIDLLDSECKFTSFKDFAGIFCKDMDERIISSLKMEGKVLKYGKVKHTYPFCERTNAPIIYRAVDAWYVKLEDIKDKLVKNNEEINWVPSNIGKNRFTNWLKEAKDWNISRNRLWGSCIPIWEAPDGEQIVIGSVQELTNYTGTRVFDLHKDTLDKILIHKNGKVFKRVPEVLDCWFESGAMPYAQFHYPFENKDKFEKSFPADFVVEGLDQTRGWFYTLLVLSTILFNKPPFKNVIVNGLILAEDGSKMSKSKNNFIPPNDILDKYGADALRVCLLNSQATHAEPFALKEENIANAYKGIILPLINSLDFFHTYSKIDKWKISYSIPLRRLDTWIINELNILVQDTSFAMGRYELNKVLPKVETFLDNLCNWYIRLSRKLFWGQGTNDAKNGAYYTLYYVISTLSKVLAPFIPFTAEYVYSKLEHTMSVHCMDFPRQVISIDDKGVMNKVREMCELGRKVRAEAKVKNRQPLKKGYVYFSNEWFRGVVGSDSHYTDLLKSELNISEIENLKENNSNKLFDLKLKPNFKTLGKKLGKDIQNFKEYLAEQSSEESYRMFSILKDVRFPFTFYWNNLLEQVGFDTGDILTELVAKKGFSSAAGDVGAITLNVELTEELVEKGFVMEFRSLAQGARKTVGLTISDRVSIEVFCSVEAELHLKKWEEFLKSELLATDMVFLRESLATEETVHSLDVNEQMVKINIFKN